MAPQVEAFHPRKLEQHIQYKTNGSKRKPQVDLNKCPLQEMIQYNCDLDGPQDDRKSRVICEPVLRLFRRCADGFTVEVTSYEDLYNQQS